MLVPWAIADIKSIPGISRRSYHTETAFQIYCVTWLRKQFELTGLPIYDKWHHSVNEHHGARLIAKLMGQSPGFPDLINPIYRIALELKIPGRRASNKQIDWLACLASSGWATATIYNFEDFKIFLKNFIESH